jgi:quinol monooxygenase YgiN
MESVVIANKKGEKMTITKEVTFVAKDNNIEELKGLLTDMVEASRAEDGCLFYYIHQLIEKPTTFVVLESWRDDEALEGHKHSSHYLHYKSHFEPFTAEKSSDELISLG